VSVLVHRGIGTAEEYKFLVDLVYSAVIRFAGKQRTYRIAEFDEQGLLTNKARTPYLLKTVPGKPVKPGYFVRHYSEEENRNDEFIRRFVDCDLAITEEFLKSRDRIKVC
jgi:hypothetical protein